MHTRNPFLFLIRHRPIFFVVVKTLPFFDLNECILLYSFLFIFIYILKKIKKKNFFFYVCGEFVK